MSDLATRGPKFMAVTSMKNVKFLGEKCQTSGLYSCRMVGWNVTNFTQ